MSGEKLGLLIVEDDEGLRSQYRWLLSDYRVMEADNRTQAREIAAREHPALAIVVPRAQKTSPAGNGSISASFAKSTTVSISRGLSET